MPSVADTIGIRSHGATALPVEQRILQLLQHLGIDQAHIAGRTPGDWTGLATAYPGVFSSFTLVGPGGFAPHTVGSLASRLLVFTGDKEASAERVRRIVENLPDARLVRLRDYAMVGWTDMVAERTDEIGSAMMHFLAQHMPNERAKTIPLADGRGEIAGISYRMRGAGPPLVLLPLFLAPSQWEPLVPMLSRHYCTITLGGVELGAVANLESRGRAAGYLRMVQALTDAAQLQPGQTVLDIGCGTGVIDRWLVRHTAGQNRIVGVDINRYLLQEAMTLARNEGPEGEVEFREGSAEALPFPDSSFDVTMSMTVIEEVDAQRMLCEMVRVTKPGGRVAVIARAMDMPFVMNLPLQAELQAKVGAPGALGSVAERGCADASLYQRFHQAGLTQVKMFPQLAAFDDSDGYMLQFMQNGLLSKLTEEEARQWQSARAEVEAEGTFFMTWPHHCAVGTKP
jgi:ubiquinone/menaquinone biosynthesis C-methylase UbiE